MGKQQFRDGHAVQAVPILFSCSLGWILQIYRSSRWASDPTSSDVRLISIRRQGSCWPLIPYLRAAASVPLPSRVLATAHLVRHLESFGLRCVYAGDIRSGQDALALDHYGAADAIITNPPWSRDVLHGLITHFQNIAPTWLLLDADWKQTRQAAPFLPHCSDIVAIGRVKWIEGSKHTGKDNACWYKFDSKHTAGPVFHWRDQGEIDPLQRRSGASASNAASAYEQWQRSSSRFCSPACKQQAYRKRLSVTPSVTAATRQRTD